MDTGSAGSKKLDLTKPVQTRDGRKVRIYGADGQPPFLIHGAISHDDGWCASVWRLDGTRHISCETTGGNDLVNVPVPGLISSETFEFKRWVNVYPSGVAWHRTREGADRYRQPGARACVEVTIKGTVGDGL